MNYTDQPSQATLDSVVAALKERNIEAIVVATKEEALAKIKELIPAGVSVMNGSSRTLEQVGFVEYLKAGQHGWNNLHEGILAEKDPEKQAALRKQSVLSDYYLGSVHALTQAGELLIASNSGSQLPHIAFTSPYVVFVVGAQKIVPTLTDGFDRLQKHVIPLENENMKQKYGSGTFLSKALVFFGENPHSKRKFQVILVKENLGF